MKDRHFFAYLLVAGLITYALLATVMPGMIAVAAPSAKEPVPVPCIHVATADSIKIYFCENIDLFVNDRGFMAFEP